jgi:hypothetical protein
MMNPADTPEKSETNYRHQLHKELLDNQHKMYLAKNADYGGSFTKLYDEFGLTSPIIKLSDKLERVKTLAKQEAQVKDESIIDTLMDMANYAVMTVIELQVAAKKRDMARTQAIVDNSPYPGETGGNV